MKPNVTGFVFARGGSKGVPRKNIRPLASKPLIAYAIECGLNSRWIERVIVSTEDEEIAGIARRYGAEVPFMRPVELSQDDSPEWLAWQHAIRETERIDGVPVDVFVCIPATSPLRAVEDLDACIEKLLDDESTDIVITVREAERSPYFNMVTLVDDGSARLVIEPEGEIYRRQDAPLVYDITTVAYVARPAFILSAGRIFDGRVQAVEVPGERALDIDTELDFLFAEFLISQKRP
jgi:CMP-N-acetylneuraminic acid synthetase